MKNIASLVLALSLIACGDGSGVTPPAGLEQLRGQWVVINYWAQWCKPCIKEIPELNTLDQRYPEVTVLGVNYDGATGEELQGQVEQLGIAFAILENDPAVQLGIARPVVLPTTLILDPTGELQATLLGPQTLESLSQLTEQLPQASNSVTDSTAHSGQPTARPLE
jgi:thiol-disulfide isomerase/thioredoxin